MLNVATTSNEAVVYVSFALTQFFANKSKPFIDDKYVEECTMK
jgi:hypothetical protein